MKSTYLVIIHPPTPDNVGRDAGNYTVPKGPQTKRVQASSPERAVEMVTVEAGGHAYVVDMQHVARFDRAKQAPLEQRRPDGNPLGRAMSNAA